MKTRSKIEGKSVTLFIAKGLAGSKKNITNLTSYVKAALKKLH